MNFLLPNPESGKIATLTAPPALRKMDRIRLIPDRLILTEEAANRSSTRERFDRWLHALGKQHSDSMVLALGCAAYPFLRIICHRLDSGDWRVSCVDANLPSHLHGHNARPIRNDEDLALALTRVRHFVSLVVTPDCHRRIIPGVGWDNKGYVRNVEAMVQIQDPDHRLLVGSHVASMKHQHEHPLVKWGQSTRWSADALTFTLYDKHAQRKSGRLDPPGIQSTRIECSPKNCKRLAQDVAATGLFQGDAGEVVRTLSLRTAYAVLRQNLARVSGCGPVIGDLPAKLSKPARHLLMGLGTRVNVRHEVDLVLENYRRSGPCERTFRTVSGEVRATALRMMAPDPSALVPPDLEDLRWSDLRLPADESAFATLVRDLEAPAVPDPEILEAWSRTTFLTKKPSGTDLAGPRGFPFSKPWQQNA